MDCLALGEKKVATALSFRRAMFMNCGISRLSTLKIPEGDSSRSPDQLPEEEFVFNRRGRQPQRKKSEGRGTGILVDVEVTIRARAIRLAASSPQGTLLAKANDVGSANLLHI